MASAVKDIPTAAVINTFSSENYVKYTDPGVEPEVPNEAALESELHHVVSRVIARSCSKHRHGNRVA